MEPGTGVQAFPLRRLTAVLTLPERRCPGVDAILGPCGHAAEAFLGAPPSHVRRQIRSWESRHRAPLYLVDLLSVQCSRRATSNSLWWGRACSMLGCSRRVPRVIPTCPPDCYSPDKHYPWSCRGVVLTCMGVDDACPHHVADGMVCRAEEQSQRWDNRSTKVGDHMHHCRNLILFCMLHGCDPSRGRLGGLVGCPPSLAFILFCRSMGVTRPVGA